MPRNNRNRKTFRPVGRAANRRRPNLGERARPGYFGEFGQDMGRVSENALRSLLKTLNVESKFADTTVSTTPSSTMAYTVLNAINEGDTGSTRDGASIKMTSIDIQLYGQLHASATLTFVRVALILDTMPDGANPGASEVFVSSNVNAFPYVPNSERFQILWDYRFFLNSVYRTAVFPITFSQDIELHTHYKGTGSGVADITQNALFLAYASSESTNTPSVGGFVRVRYVDN